MDLKKSFREFFQCDPVFEAKAPGRVNLIGEHTDYNDGYVMPAAIEYAVTVLASPRDDRKMYLYSVDFNASVSFSLDEEIQSDPEQGWSNYERGVIVEFQKLGHKVRGANLLIQGNVPLGAGLSSSAAVEMATAVMINAMNDAGLSQVDLVKLAQRAENQFVGMQCGIMDQFISGMGKEGQALFLDCRSLDYKLVPFPGDTYSIVIMNTKVKRELTGSEYNERRSQCEEGVNLLQHHLLGITALRDVSVEDFECNKGMLPDLVRRRCEHVVYEDARVLDFIDALEKKDGLRIGRLLQESHVSLKDLYEVSCPELDKIVEIALSVDGVIGARMTGAGFGGCAVALVEKGKEEALKAKILSDYPEATGIQPEVYVSTPSEGAWASKL